MDIYDRRCKEYYGGIKNLWLTPFVDYDESEIFVYDNELSVFPDTTLYQYKVDGNYTQSYGSDDSWSQSIGIKLPEFYGSVLPSTLKNTKFRAVIETNNGYYLMFGLICGLNVAMTNASGAGYAEFSGLELTFSGTEEESAVIVDINDFFDTVEVLGGADLALRNSQNELILFNF